MQDNTSPQQDASASSSLSEKKRNKLGYHRTSVACVHCRRRKIRCLVDQNDQQGRCQNCIRLKKECNFYPVDQQPPPERGRRSGAKASSQPSSSPAPPNQGPGEGYPYGPPAVGYAPQPGGMPGNPMQIAPINTQDFNNAQLYMDGPMSAPGHFSDAGTPGIWPPYSAGPESARSAQFPNFAPGRADAWPAQSPMHHPQSMAPMAPGVPGQQPRSMSLQHDSQGTYGNVPMGNGVFYDRGGPPSLQNSNGSPATTVSLSDAAAAPGQVAASSMHYGIPQHWDPNKDFNGSGNEMAGGWYAGTVPNMPEDNGHNWQHHQAQHTPAGFK